GRPGRPGGGIRGRGLPQPLERSAVDHGPVAGGRVADRPVIAERRTRPAWPERRTRPAWPERRTRPAWPERRTRHRRRRSTGLMGITFASRPDGDEAGEGDAVIVGAGGAGPVGPGVDGDHLRTTGFTGQADQVAVVPRPG